MAFTFPIHLEYFSPLTALAVFLALAIPTVLLGMWSLNGLGSLRKWVAIGVRLLVLLGIVLLLGGIRWQREHKRVDVTVIRDLSDSTSYVQEHPQATLRESVNEFMQASMSDPRKKPEDAMAVIGFAERAMIETLPSTRLDLGTRSVMEGGRGTDIASAIQLALASMGNDAMHRLVLVSDGNVTAGNLDAAIEAAAAQNIPIDVMPLRYSVDSAVMMDRFVAPTWRRQNEPMTLEVIVRSTAATPVNGTLVILHQGKPVDIDSDAPGMQTARRITLQPGPNKLIAKVPPLAGGIHNFRAVVEIDKEGQPGNTQPIVVTSSMDAFTIVQGQGSILYIDNVPQGGGADLANALRPEGIDLIRGTIEDIPRDLFGFQNYDAVILANVPNGSGGVDQEQDTILSTYVHDMGGGLIMLGGPDSFGAGGWQGSKVEKILPVNMDVPARKEVGKGALVLIVHACEFPNGNYWGQQCAIKAIDALSSYDEIGIITYDWRGGGGSQWDFPLQVKGDGSKAKAAAKQMQQGDMPHFEDSMEVALYGSGGQKGLENSDARHKHVIIISDGDPIQPPPELLAAYRDAKVSASTISVYPHDLSSQGLPPTMRMIAEALKGRAYGPVNGNFNQLPQIFIKEARIVRRTLIYEDAKGIPLALKGNSDIVQGLGSDLPPVYGMVLTSKKVDPLIDMPIVAGKAADPLLAHWQTGLGKTAAFTSDATRKWAPNWVGSSAFGKFWAQVVRSVARPPMSRDMDIQTRTDGDKILIRAEAMDRDKRSINFLNVTGQIVGPDMQAHDIQLNQTGPGVYEAVIEKAQPGAHVARVSYVGPKGEAGWQVAGVAINTNPEMRDLRSNDAVLEQIATRTGGRVLEPFDVQGADLFRREGLKKTASPMPIWDILLPILMGLVLVDVSVRRIAWDFRAIWSALTRYADTFRSQRKDRSESVDALRRLRSGTREPEPAATVKQQVAAPADRPDPSRKFEGAGISGDINKVVGGASDDAPRKPTGQPAASGEQDHISGLLAAKRRARNQMDKKDDQKGEL